MCLFGRDRRPHPANRRTTALTYQSPNMSFGDFGAERSTSSAAPLSILRRELGFARHLFSNVEVLGASVAINLLSLGLPIFLLQIYDRIIPNEAFSTLTLFGMALACVLLLDAFLSICRAYITGWNGARVQHSLSCAAMDRMLSSNVQAFEASAPGVQLQRMRAIDTIRNFYTGQAALLWIDLPFAIIFLALIAVIGQELTLMPIAIMALAAIGAVWSGRRLHAALEDRTGNDNRRYNFIIDVLGKVATVKAIGMESLMVRRYERLQGHSAAATYRSTFYSSLARSAGAMSSQIMIAGVAAYGCTLVIEGSLSVGSLAACTLLAGRAARPLLRLLGVWTQYQTVQIARRQVAEIFSLPTDREMATSGEEPKVFRPSPAWTGRIEFRNLSMQYDSAKSGAILRDLNLTIDANEVIGVTGSNGCGKSTLLHLISGLIKPSAGRVLVDGTDIEDYEPGILCSQICYLPQTGILFDGTILDNLTLFQNDERLDAALEVAQRLGLTDVIARLPEGYETRVSSGREDGLPDGLKQSITIARSFALSDDPRILLFDEANALLDPQTDQRLIELLNDYRGRTTMVLVSHRPTLLGIADRVFVLRDGRMVPGQLSPPPMGGAARKDPAR